MTSMVERVADAIQDVASVSESGGLNYEDMARAAISAMREPTSKMQQVVSANWGRRTWAEYDEVIDAALEEKV